MPARIIHIDRADLRLGPKVWAFAETRREEIDAHFRATQAVKPALWNGRVLLLHDYAVTDGVMFGAFLETDFASFLAWRDWGWPDSSV